MKSFHFISSKGLESGSKYFYFIGKQSLFKICPCIVACNLHIQAIMPNLFDS